MHNVSVNPELYNSRHASILAWLSNLDNYLLHAQNMNIKNRVMYMIQLESTNYH